MVWQIGWCSTPMFLLINWSYILFQQKFRQWWWMSILAKSWSMKNIIVGKCWESKKHLEERNATCAHMFSMRRLINWYQEDWHLCDMSYISWYSLQHDMSMLTADLLRRSDVGARDVEQQIEIAWTQRVLYVENKKGSIKHAHTSTGENL